MAQKKVTRKRHKFVYTGKPGSVVSVAGSFNEWSTGSHQLKDKSKSGGYELSVLLPRETIAYKLIVDGEWIVDPTNPEIEIDSSGIENNILDLS